MPDEIKTKSENVGEMHKRREIMADGKRYLIYYTFGASQDSAQPDTESLRGEVKN